MAKRKATHTSCKKGKRVFVKLANGEKFVDKFVEKRGRGIVLEERGYVTTKELLVMTIYRNQEGD